jgi:hypothetical protein
MSNSCDFKKMGGGTFLGFLKGVQKIVNAMLAAFLTEKTAVRFSLALIKNIMICCACFIPVEFTNILQLHSKGTYL